MFLREEIIGSFYIDYYQKMLLIGIQTQGIFIYRIENEKSYLNQFIPIFNFVIHLNMKLNRGLIYFGDAQNLMIFESQKLSSLQQQQQNDQNSINIYNKHQCFLTVDIQDEYPYQSQIDEDGSFLFIAAGFQGLLVYDLRDIYFPKQIFSKAKHNVSHDTLLYLQKKQILIVGQSEQGMIFYKINKQEDQKIQIIEIKEFKLEDVANDCDDLTSNDQENIIVCANGIQGFYAINIYDIQNIYEVGRFNIQSISTGVESQQYNYIDENGFISNSFTPFKEFQSFFQYQQY
ncbi:hypothetical protein IMG5_204530 [Ichthyophthirius multifiliis]|uniref:WD40-repeat-containing domain n=1 Tax=Ichthyophthirius multifiliis TaxID=5932 RepID=G0R6H9_ICHMU|nr:hypothetical protein IMG5_204530 [Ichthyophthirius multifiliis]EGR26941.1 hypothetical protein IMG5_204530 [Ichthyophthirius multifiliis]|eukprot:XP_004023825.1 hypothetical protein IMG5_204530 [Ichthyophthirius multifiliis]